MEWNSPPAHDKNTTLAPLPHHRYAYRPFNRDAFRTPNRDDAPLRGAVTSDE